ncbi:MAG: DUF4126 domain-containing protein [Rickettsiales bacterium]|nr:DUF4126 domain-containing protein [Rickettsiales bacterium]
MVQEIIIILSFAISIAAGINLFGSLFILSLFTYFNFIEIKEYNFLSNEFIISALFLLFLFEFIVDKIRGFDCALDSILFFAKIPIASFLSFLLAVNYDIFTQTGFFVLGGLVSSISHFIKLGIKIMANTSSKPENILVISVAFDFFIIAILLSVVTNHLVFYTILGLFLTFISWFLPEIFKGVKNIKLVVYGILTGYNRKISPSKK